MEDKTLYNEFVAEVKATENLIKNNKNWVELFSGYAEKINNNLNIYNKTGIAIKNKLKNDINLDEVQLYSSVGLLNDDLVNKPADYDLRYCGRHICNISISDGKIHLKFKKNDKRIKQKLSIQEKYECQTISLNSLEANDIFSQLEEYKKEGTTYYKPEHRLESLILREMGKEQDKDKWFKYMRPVLLGAGFFQMPVPLKASGKEPEFLRGHSGHIDILARVTKKVGNDWRLAVIEIKDKSESVNKAMKQALRYATFIGHLLEDEKIGKVWFNIFRNKIGNFKDILESFEILVMTMMPKKKRGIIRPIDDPPDSMLTGNQKPKGIKLDTKKISVTLIPCTCFLDVDNNFTKIKDADGTYSNYKKSSK